MGYSHGKKWTFEKVKDEVLKIAGVSGVMPSFSVMDEITGNKGLSVAVSRYGGYKAVAEKLNLKIKKCETETGRNYEVFCLQEIEKRFSLDGEQMTVKHPYDLLISGAVKIDVKASKKSKIRNSFYYSFNLGKKAQTCDIFICYCIDDDDIDKTYVIPAVVLSGKCQLSVGIEHSIYDNYLDQWHYVSDYANFMKEGIM